MTQPQRESSQDYRERKQLLQAAARRLVASFDWSLVTADSLAELAARHLPPAALPSAAQAAAACQTAYSRLLYEACAGTAQREAGYRELHGYLYRLAYNRVPESDAADVAQEALRLVFENLATCRQPETFLKFAYFRLRHAINRVRPARVLRTQSLEPWLESAGQPSPSFTPLFRNLPEPDAALLVADDVSRVRECLQRIRRQQPRARLQLQALVLKYFEELDDTTIAERLDTSVANVHVLRSRGLTKLRACLSVEPAEE